MFARKFHTITTAVAMTIATQKFQSSVVSTKHGMMLGALEGLTFDDEHYKLKPGDALFVYTDGVPEANNKDELMFGEDKLESALSTVLSDDTSHEVMKKVRNAVDLFVGTEPQYDDLTMLCLEWK